MALRDVIGQEPVLRFLRAALANRRLTQGYLLLGPAGTGKRFLAGQFAAAILCSDDPREDACGVCASCRLVAQGTHPDLVTAQPDGISPIKIEQVRQIVKVFSLKPAMGSGRVALVVDADALTEEAANAVLKTLEEPPPGSTLLLTAASADRLLPTIVSRCQTVRTAPVEPTVVADYLVRQRGADRSLARLVARGSGGRIGRAVEMLTDGWMAMRERVVGALLREPPDVAAVLSADDRERLIEELQIVAQWYRDVWLVQWRGEVAPVVHADRLPTLRTLAGRLQPRAVAGAVEAVDRAYQAARQHANAKLIVNVLTMELADVVR